jgi:hypothetical protein
MIPVLMCPDCLCFQWLPRRCWRCVIVHAYEVYREALGVMDAMHLGPDERSE